MDFKDFRSLFNAAFKGFLGGIGSGIAFFGFGYLVISLIINAMFNLVAVIALIIGSGCLYIATNIKLPNPYKHQIDSVS